MTWATRCKQPCPIIPYQELLGNYDPHTNIIILDEIIPYQELLGNYDIGRTWDEWLNIIPYQELLGNYDVRY